jgi:ribosomal protein S18 acetylase RimI-like enzyme
MASITTWENSSNPEQHLPRLREIFFECSDKKEFASKDDRHKFQNKWLGHYLEQYQEHIFLSVDQQNKLQGYLTGCPNSRIDKTLMHEHPTMAVFEEHLENYPAHLHLNCHPESQGKGLGRQLIKQYINQLQRQGVSGVHIITAKDALNIGFYKKTGFQFIASKKWKKLDLVMLGIKL